MTLRNGSRAAVLLVACVAATSAAGCSAGPSGREARGTQPPMQQTPMQPTTGTPSPAAPPTVVVDSLGLPVPPPGSTTSDRGHRLARPTPIGQLAPEEPPPETPAAPAAPATPVPPAR